jgi:hypothetical protein
LPLLFSKDILLVFFVAISVLPLLVQPYGVCQPAADEFNVLLRIGNVPISRFLDGPRFLMPPPFDELPQALYSGSEIVFRLYRL